MIVMKTELPASKPARQQDKTPFESMNLPSTSCPRTCARHSSGQGGPVSACSVGALYRSHQLAPGTAWASVPDAAVPQLGAAPVPEQIGQRSTTPGQQMLLSNEQQATFSNAAISGQAGQWNKPGTWSRWRGHTSCSLVAFPPPCAHHCHCDHTAWRCHDPALC